MTLRIVRLESLLVAVSAIAVMAVTSACSRDVQALSPQQIEQQYGVSGAYTDTLVTTDGSMKATVVPVTLADGRRAHLVIPAQRRDEAHALYLRRGRWSRRRRGRRTDLRRGDAQEIVGFWLLRVTIRSDTRQV